MKKISPVEIIQQVLLENNFKYRFQSLYRGINKEVIFDYGKSNFLILFIDYENETEREYVIPIKSHQSINKVLDRIELLTNKKLKTPTFKI